MKTKSERLFEEFLERNALPFEKIKEETTPRPDYLVWVANTHVVFELKELVEDDSFGIVKDPLHPQIRSHSRIVGDHIRRRIEGARKQIQYGAKQGLATVLLIYNCLDPNYSVQNHMTLKPQCTANTPSC